MEEEIWKAIPYAPDYMVSNLGRVMSLKFNRRKILSAITNPMRYLTVNLAVNGKQKHSLIHVLVWDTFSGKSRVGLQIDHIDNNKTNNCFSNLQLLTIRENTIKAAKCRNKTSKYTGVGYNKRYNVWVAYIGKGKKRKHLGVFQDEKTASLVYQYALSQVLDGKSLSELKSYAIADDISLTASSRV